MKRRAGGRTACVMGWVPPAVCNPCLPLREPRSGYRQVHSVFRRRKFRPQRADQNSSAWFIAECVDTRTSFTQPKMLDMMRVVRQTFLPVDICILIGIASKPE